MVKGLAVQQDTIATSDSLEASLLSSKGIELFNKTLYDSSFAVFEESSSIAAFNNYRSILGTNNYYQGMIMEKLGDWQLALRYYLKALPLFSVTGNRAGQAEINSLIASRYFDYGLYQKSTAYSSAAFDLYPREDVENRIREASRAARSSYLVSNFAAAMRWHGIVHDLAIETGDTVSLKSSWYGRSGSSMATGDLSASEMYLLELLPILERMDDSKGLADIYNSIGLIEFESGDTDRAIDYFNQATAFYEKAGGGSESALSNIAICYQNRGNSKLSEEYFERALSAASSNRNIAEKARLEHILASLSFRRGDLYHADYYCRAAVNSAKQSGNYEVLQKSHHTWSEVLRAGNDFVAALDNYERFLTIRDSLAFEERLREREAEDLRASMESYEEQLRYDLADEELREMAIRNLRIENEKRANDMKLLERENEVALLEQERLQQSMLLDKERYNNMVQEQEIMVLEQQRLLQRRDSVLQENEARELLQQNRLLEYEARQQQQEIEREQQARRWAIFMAVSAVFSLLIILLSLISTRRKNAKLTQQKKIIEEKNLTITDSIEYASRIQNAVLPPPAFLTEWGFESFIMFRPKDIVSGDFYWGMKSGDYLCFAAADCTGHGVPGAFMSMLGTAFLNEIINSREFENAGDILNRLRGEVISSLRQRGVEGEAQDGMDIALCLYDRKKKLIHFAGANNPMYHVQNGSLERVGPDKMPIGIHVALDRPFANHVVKPGKGDMIYLFSDGYADQFGGDEGKKFKYKPFRDMLLEISSLPLSEQKSIVEERFDSWKGDTEQIDDVLLIGVRF